MAEEPPSRWSCVAGVKRIKRQKFTTAGPKDEDDMAEEPPSRWSSFAGVKRKKILPMCGTEMSNADLLLFLERLTRLRIPVGEPATSQVFPELRGILRIRMTSFTARELVRIFEAVHQLKVEGGPAVLNEIIEAVRLKLRDLSLEELLEFFTLIKRVETHRSSHLEMMKTVLPVIFGYRCREEFDMSQVEHCYRALMLALETKVSRRNLTSIADAALESSAHFSSEQALDLFEQVGIHQIAWQDIDSLRTILENCMETLAIAVPRMDQRIRDRMLRAMMNDEIGTKSLFDALWESAPSWSLPQVARLLWASTKDYLYMTPKVALLATRMILAKSDQLTGQKALPTSILAVAVSTAFWSQYPVEPDAFRKIECERAANALIQALENQRKFLSFRGRLLNFLIDLAHMGIYPESLFQRAFSPEFQDKCSPMEIMRLRKLERQLLLHSGKKWHPRLKPELARVDRRDRDVGFERALYMALGGRKLYRWNIRTPIGSFIEYVVAMRTMDRAIRLPQEGNFFENVPPATKVVAIVIERKHLNVYKLTGLRKVEFLMYERELRAQNLCSIIIDRDHFVSLGQREANAYISESLKNAFLNGPEYAPWYVPTGVIDGDSINKGDV